MPRISNRILNITPPGDDGWGLFYRARALKAAGRPILELTIGEHDIPMRTDIIDAMYASAKNGRTTYAEVPGIPPLRAAVANRLSKSTGIAYGPENVIIVGGGQSGLFATHRAVCDEGDRAVMIEPHYTTYPGVIRSVGAEPVIVSSRPRDGFQPRKEDLRAAAPGARSLLINSPNNPTGAVYSDETMNGVAAVAEEFDLWVISDEVYDTQIWESAHRPFASLPGMAERTLTIGSLSKSHAMTGSRLGWIVGPEEIISQLINLATHTTFGVPSYIQEAGLYALSLGESIEEEVAAPFKRRRDIVLARLAEQQVLTAIPPAGAMYVMLDVRATGLTGREFGEQLLEEAEVAIMPGDSFGAAAAGHIRLALTLPDELFTEALERIIAFAASKAG